MSYPAISAFSPRYLRTYSKELLAQAVPIPDGALQLIHKLFHSNKLRYYIADEA